MNIENGTRIQAPTPEFAKRGFSIKKQLGKGGEGQVFLATPFNWNYDFDVALKISNQIKVAERQFIQKLIEDQNYNEQQGFKSQIVTNIIRIYDSFEIESYSFQVMEVGSSNLFTYMKDNRNKLTNLQKFKICSQLLNAINFIHKQGLIHRDIKGENFILVNEEFKLIDFGLISTNRLMTSKQGTRIFQAPELFEDEGQYTQSLDIWALGCVFYEIIKEEELFPCMKIKQSLEQIKNHKKDQRHVYQLIDELKVCFEWKELLKQMLHPNQFDRINIEKAIKKVNNCIAQEGNYGMPKELVNQFQPNNDYQNINKFDFEQQLNQKQSEFNKVIREKDLLIITLQNKIEQQENDAKQQLNDIESLKKQINKFEQERNNWEQEKEKYEEQIKKYQQYSLSCQNQLNYQIAQINTQQTQQFNQQKLILDNEIRNLRIRIQQLEQENQSLQKKLNQSKDEENTQSYTNKEMIFLDKLIRDLTNEISNLMKSLESFKNIKQILVTNNNTLLNSQIQEIEQLIIEKNKNLSNYEKIKSEIQNLDQTQQKQQQFDVFKTGFEIKTQSDITPLQKPQSLQQFTNMNQQSQLQVPYQFKPSPSFGNLQVQAYPPFGFPPPYLNMQNSQLQNNQNSY